MADEQQQGTEKNGHGTGSLPPNVWAPNEMRNEAGRMFGRIQTPGGVDFGAGAREHLGPGEHFLDILGRSDIGSEEELNRLAISFAKMSIDWENQEMFAKQEWAKIHSLYGRAHWFKLYGSSSLFRQNKIEAMQILIQMLSPDQLKSVIDARAAATKKGRR